LLSYRTNTGKFLDTGDGTVGVHDIVGGTLQQALQDTADAEGGVLYINPQGQARFKQRDKQYNSTSAFTLDASVDQVAVGTTFRIDLSDVINDAQISRPNGAATQRSQDTSSQQSFGVVTVQDTLIVNTDWDAANAAGWMVAANSQPRPSSPNVTVDLYTETNVTLVQAIMNVRPWTRFTLANLPATAPYTSWDLIIQGWQETITADSWSIEFYTGPTVPNTLRADATADAFTLLDSGLKIGW
jgi:hypothetical protein